MNEADWLLTVETRIRAFAHEHSSTYALHERQISACFEIGCFHALLEFYRVNFSVAPQNLKNGEYRYLTTPSGNPANFSFIRLARGDEEFFLRQQIRVRSSANSDIRFTPDFVVYRSDTKIHEAHDPDYAHGKRGFFFVKGSDLVAVHECKSMNPFPELLISFLGMLIAAHPWASKDDAMDRLDPAGWHLAPSLFVGGTPRGLDKRMARAIEKTYPVNIILGMHYGTWHLLGGESCLNFLK